MRGWCVAGTTVFLFLSGIGAASYAQMDHMHQMGEGDSSMAMGQPMDHRHGAMAMRSMILLSVPMERDGSGTSWLPDASPMHAVHMKLGSWSAMVHGAVDLRYTAQDAFRAGARGGSLFDAPNWFMLMASHPLGARDQAGFRAMMSLDRLTEGGEGYPLLFQTGESWHGRPLVDQQHPHDLFMELAGAYSRSLGGGSALSLYLGYPGEPALGPPAFMHRPSAMDLPDAPLGHHWQDATHISFGVATLGWQFHQVKLEGSVFTGREPDENRWNFDKPRMDSFSGRISVNPTAELALQVSRGYLRSPELLEPGVDQIRTTASAIYSHRFGSGGAWSSAVVWGMNRLIGDRSQQSLLVESDADFSEQRVFGRFEAIQKSAGELEFGGDPDRLFSVFSLGAGTSRRLFRSEWLEGALGVQATVYATASELEGVYGKNPAGLEIFLNLRPSLPGMAGMTGTSDSMDHGE